MPNYLITGMSGAGKSAVGGALRDRGLSVLDVDYSDATGWVDAKTLRPAKYTHGDGYEHLRELLYFWKSEILVPLLRRGAASPLPNFFDGYAQNIQSFYPYFHKMFLLTADKRSIEHRLLTRTNGDWGKDPAELRQSVEDLESYQDQLRGAGAIVIDSAQPLEQIVSEILELCR
ncbi:MAG TPA: hypothetical protein VF261_01860 [Candidatus Saccharimonadales bacterium]